MAKILNIVETAYRGTLEEQDDTILWLSHIFKNSGADISVLLRSNAVNYSLKGQEASGLVFGETMQKNSPKIDRDLTKIIETGTPVYLVREDAEERGLNETEMLPGIKFLSRKDLPALLDQFDKIWHW